MRGWTLPPATLILPGDAAFPIPAGGCGLGDAMFALPFHQGVSIELRVTRGDTMKQEKIETLYTMLLWVPIVSLSAAWGIAAVLA